MRDERAHECTGDGTRRYDGLMREKDDGESRLLHGSFGVAPQRGIVGTPRLRARRLHRRQ